MVSVKQNPEGTYASSSSINRSGGRITLDNVTLRESIAFAYDIATGRDYELSGPGWLDTVKFKIVVTFPPDTSRDRVREMMQTLLAERFRLRTHSENRKVDSYALVVGKGGPRLQQDTTGVEGAYIWGAGHLTARAISIQGLADRLSGPNFRLDRPVVNMTGIGGAYDFTLSWAMKDAAPADGESAPSIFTALEEQLGLRLEPKKLTLRILVVDSVERVPIEN